MAKEPRKRATDNQSIVRHPLFPATVALWFGALFGLGSLAVRPGLLETAVLAAHLDVLIPAAAPPLGATTRILVSLFMAGAGGLLGATLARRIARPRPVVVPRKRGAGAVGNPHKASRPNHGSGEQQAAPQVSGGNRRRQLAFEEEQPKPPEYRDQVPVPGGAPQIFDVSAFDLDGFETVEDDEPACTVRGSFKSEGGRAVGTNREPVVTPTNPFDPPSGAQVFKPSQLAEGNLDAQLGPGAQPRTALGNGLFDAYAQGLGASEAEKSTPFAPAPFSEQPSTIQQVAEPEAEFSALPRLGAQGADSQWSEEAPPVEAPFQNPTLALEPAPRLFGEAPGPAPAPFAPPPAEPDGEPDECLEGGAMLTRPSAAAPEAEASRTESSSSDPDLRATCQPNGQTQDNRHLDRDASEVMTRPSAEGSAGERIASAELGDLSDVELLERLALTMQSRRVARTLGARGSTPAVPVVQNPSAPGDAGESEFGEAPFAPTAPPPVGIPAALRPIGLGEEDDDDLLPSYIPPRRISLPQDDHASFVETGSEPAACPGGEAGLYGQAEGRSESFTTSTGPRQADAEEDGGDDDESRVLEEGYSSLLDLSRRQESKEQFVRIEEPEFAGGQVEPVVVFPGQEPARGRPLAAQPPSGTATPSAATTAYDQGTRLPTSVEPAPFAGPPAASPPPFAPPQPRRDPAETERALRTALATLQRISGAA